MRDRKINFFIDLDGPILDVSNKYYQVYVESLRRLGRNSINKDTYWRMKKLKISDYDILSLTSSESYLEDFRAYRNALIEDSYYLEFDSVWVELKEIYQKLFDKYPMILVTLRTYPDRMYKQLKNMGIYYWFKSILVCRGDTIKRWKTKAKAVENSKILKNTSAENCIFIGDTETDILSGQYLGMKTIGVSFGIRDRELLAQLKPNLLFDSPSELAAYFTENFM